MLGISNNSLNTKTPGAAVASSASLAAAAPLADFAMSKNGSSLEEELLKSIGGGGKSQVTARTSRLTKLKLANLLLYPVRNE
jgi:hypothetical protein